MIAPKKDKVIQFRVNDEDLKFLTYCATMLGMTVSRYCRMVVDTTLVPLKLKVKNGDIKYEDIEAVLND